MKKGSRVRFSHFSWRLFRNYCNNENIEQKIFEFESGKYKQYLTKWLPFFQHRILNDQTIVLVLLLHFCFSQFFLFVLHLYLFSFHRQGSTNVILACTDYCASNMVLWTRVFVHAKLQSDKNDHVCFINILFQFEN